MHLATEVKIAVVVTAIGFAVGGIAIRAISPVRYYTKREYIIAKKNDTVLEICKRYFPMQDKYTDLDTFVSKVEKDNGFKSGRRALKEGDSIHIVLEKTY